jgi:sugar phosphate isomerase/epimerase
MAHRSFLCVAHTRPGALAECHSAIQPIANRRYALRRSADWQSAVSPVGNRQSRPLSHRASFIPLRRAHQAGALAECHSAIQPIANRRYVVGAQTKTVQNALSSKSQLTKLTPSSLSKTAAETCHLQKSPTFMLPLNRRNFAKLSLAALPGAALLRATGGLRGADAPAAAVGRPNSKVAGVQLGLNVPYSFNNGSMSGDDILKNCVQLGVSGVELRTQPVEAFLGAPTAKGELPAWRKSVSTDRAREFRKKYETAGVLIEIVKVDGIFAMTDDELDYVFPLAKALGARAISTEISNKDADLKRLGKFADNHKLMMGYHGHAATTPEHWEKAFSFAEHNGANVDLGHFVAGNNVSPIPFIRQHHARITHVHLKDRKMHEGPNTPFGEGDTPIAETLRAIRDNKWPIQGTIEFEYKIPAGSDRMTEIARALRYCRDALA